jgi:glycosyltransferase involved in cell wall biosynthesis
MGKGFVMKKRQKISVILASKNEEKFVENFFKSLKKQTRKPDEVILVDCSTDRTPELAKKYVDKLIRAKKCGVGYQRGLGVKNSTGDLLLFTDVDTQLYPDWIEKIEKKFEDPDVHVVRGTVLWPEIQRDIPVQGKRINHCNTAYRRHVLEEIPFDPEIVRGDDFDMGYRVSKKYVIYGVPEAKVMHFSFQKIGLDKTKSFMKAYIFLLKKYKNPYWLLRIIYNIFYLLIDGKPAWFVLTVQGLIVAIVEEFRK